MCFLVFFVVVFRALARFSFLFRRWHEQNREFPLWHQRMRTSNHSREGGGTALPLPPTFPAATDNNGGGSDCRTRRRRAARAVCGECRACAPAVIPRFLLPAARTTTGGKACAADSQENNTTKAAASHTSPSRVSPGFRCRDRLHRTAFASSFFLSRWSEELYRRARASRLATSGSTPAYGDGSGPGRRPAATRRTAAHAEVGRVERLRVVARGSAWEP